MSDWNDAIYEYYDNKRAEGLSHEEAELALNKEMSRQLFPELSQTPVPFPDNVISFPIKSNTYS